MPLPKPFAVMKKHITRDELNVEYVVEALITHKLFFKARPKPIIESDKFLSH